MIEAITPMPPRVTVRRVQRSTLRLRRVRAEIDRLYAGLSEGGQVMMELGPYPFAVKYAWVQDRFGVSWMVVVMP